MSGFVYCSGRYSEADCPALWWLERKGQTPMAQQSLYQNRPSAKESRRQALEVRPVFHLRDLSLAPSNLVLPVSENEKNQPVRDFRIQCGVMGKSTSVEF